MTLSADKANIGDLVESTGTFKRRSTLALADPTTITLTVTPPSGTAVTVTYGGAGSGQVGAIARSSAGIYTSEVTINAAGTWKFKWQGTGDVVAGSPAALLQVRS